MTRRQQAPQVDVLIVGAGPVGLALAIELGMQGRTCLVVERNERTGLAPRAKTTNVRSREIMRRWGIADELAQASPFGIDYPHDIVFATRLAGFELARFQNGLHGSPVRDPRFPEHAQWIPQYKVEDILRRRAASLPGVEMRMRTRLTALRTDDGGVLPRVEDVGSGAGTEICSRYLVGADGARSTVRHLLGIPMHGTSPLSHHHNIVFRSPGLDKRHALGPAIMYWLVNAQVPAVLSPLDQGDLWSFGCEKLGDASAEPAALIRAALGMPDLPVEVLSRDEWVAHRLMAERYRAGRVFLVGDACHLHPPFGGYGMNMGIGDALDLGWKLSATLAGWGGAALLDSYEIERRQAHQRVIDESVSNHLAGSRSFALEHIEDDDALGRDTRAVAGRSIRATKQREFDSLGLVLGSYYDDSPVIVPDGTPPIEIDPRHFEPSARPGSRAPHLWLCEGKARGASLFDRFALTGFTLLLADGAEGLDRDRVEEAARSLGVPLVVLDLPDARLRTLYRRRYALIRPDGFVAWRGDRLKEAACALEKACGRATATT